MAIFFILLLLLPELYVWHEYVRPLHWSLGVAYWLPLVAAVVLMVMVQTHHYQAWMFRWSLTLILLFVIPQLLFALFAIVGHVLGWGGHAAGVPAVSVMGMKLGARTVFSAIGAAVGVLSLVIVFYGLFFGWRKMTVRNIDLEYADLPAAFDGYRIVHLSDLHIGTYHHAPEVVDSMVSMVNGIDADLVVFTGDLVNVTPEELDPFMNVLPAMKARDGVYSIMGNHDYCSYRRYDSQQQHAATIADLQQRERKLGWHLLLNDNAVIRRANDSILVAGVENSSRPPFPDYGDLTKTFTPKAPATGLPAFKVLLSHDPTHWRRAVLSDTDAQLQLSGHTHATQFKLFGWSPSQHVYDEWGGLYREGSRVLNVSTGTGGNLPFRFGAWPEIVVITLHRK